MRFHHYDLQFTKEGRSSIGEVWENPQTIQATGASVSLSAEADRSSTDDGWLVYTDPSTGKPWWWNSKTSGVAYSPRGAFLSPHEAWEVYTNPTSGKPWWWNSLTHQVAYSPRGASVCSGTQGVISDGCEA